MILRSDDNCLQAYAVGQRKDVATVGLLNLLALAIAMPGAIDALADLLARRDLARQVAQRRTTRLDIDLHVSIRRS
jgi:hypothetical protein